MNSIPNMFIGSSAETLNVATALERELAGEISIEVWDKSFRPGHYTLSELERKAREVNFAAFIVGQDDLTESRGEVKLSPRDNVIYEAGLFAGHIGVPNVFLLIDDQGIKIPTDWKGLGYITYSSQKDYAAMSIGSAAQKIRKAVADWKKEAENDFKNEIIGSWWQFVINRDEKSVLSRMEIVRLRNSLKIRGRSWTNEGKLVAKYESRALALDEDNRKIFYYWEGEYPHYEKASNFFGCGEIEFSQDDANEQWQAEGWYSESPLSNLDGTTRNSVLYKRATDEQVEIARSEDNQHFKKLIAGLLREREKLIKNRKA